MKCFRISILTKELTALCMLLLAFQTAIAQPIYTCNATFYDTGGPSGSYSNNQNYTVTYCSDNGGPITVSDFYINIENTTNCQSDYIRLYDGSTTINFVGGWCGTGSLDSYAADIPFTSTGSCLTFQFVSDGSITGSGWSATISCPLPDCLDTLVSPMDNQDVVDVNTNLSWDAVDFATGYNVYFGTSYPITDLVSSNQPGTSYDPGTLDYSSTYYWMVVPLNSNGSAIGCQSFDFNTELDANLPPPVVSGQYACPGMPVELTGTIGAGGNTLRWYDNSGSLLHTGISYTNTYWNSTLVNVSTYNSFSGFESSSLTPVYITMNQYNAPTIIDYTSGCAESPFYANATPGNGCNTIRWYDAPSGGNIVYTGSAISDVLTTPFNLYASSFDNVTGCESEERILLELGLNNLDPPSPLLLDTSFCNGKIVDLYLQPSIGGNSLKWYDQSNTLLHTGLVLNKTINSGLIYHVSSFNSFTGCESDQKSIVNVIALPEECVELSFNVPSAITPNADGFNDLWEIENATNYSDFTISVFNRLGQQVFYSNGVYNAWDAKYNGKLLPKGDYFYIITSESHSYTQKGVVSIVK